MRAPLLEQQREAGSRASLKNELAALNPNPAGLQRLSTIGILYILTLPLLSLSLPFSSHASFKLRHLQPVHTDAYRQRLQRVIPTERIVQRTNTRAHTRPPVFFFTRLEQCQCVSRLCQLCATTSNLSINLP